MSKTPISWIALFSALSLGACGGAAAPAADAPEAEAAETDKQPEAPAESAEPKEKQDGDGEGEAAAEEPASSSESSRHRKAADTLLAENTRFVLSFERSEVGEKAVEACEKFASKPQKKTACISKERKKITADVLHFMKDDADQWYWITSRQNGSALKQVSKLKIELGKESGSSVEVVTKGPGGGDTVTIEIPDDYTIIVPSSKYGKLVYEAKVGLEK